MPAASSSARKLNVFISYSRQDMAFVDRLQAALAERDIQAFVDREAIEKGEAWWARITQLITEADTIVFALSPGSVDSAVCKDEVEFAERLNKRFVPIVVRDLERRSVPAALSRLSYIFFIPNPSAGASGDFDGAVGDLVRALETDIPWIREHTRLGALAERWKTRNRPGDLLLRGAELDAAETWLTTRPEKAPDPTDAHRALITLSRQAATRRRNTLTASLAAGLLVALGLAGLAYWQRGIAVEQRDATLMTESRLLADAAYQAIRAGDAATGILLALEGLPNEEEGKGRPVVKETESMLLSGLLNLRERAVLDIRSVAAVSPNGRRLAHATANNAVEVIDIATKEKLAALRHDGKLKSIAFSADESRLVTLAADGSAAGGLIRIWDLATARQVLQLKSYAGFNGVSLSPDGRKLLLINGTESEGPNHGAMVWDTVTLARLLLLSHPKSVVKAAYSPDGRLLATATGDRDTSVGAATIEDDDNDDNVVRVFDAVTGARRHELKGARGSVQALAISPDNSLLVAASGDGIAYVWKLSDGKLKYRLWHADAPSGAGFLGGGASIVTTAGGTIFVWDAETGTRLEPHAAYIKPLLKGVAYTENGLAFDAKRKALVTTHDDDTARLWDLSPATATVLHPDCPNRAAWLRVTRDGSRILVRCLDTGRVKVWDAARQGEPLEFSAPRRAATVGADYGLLLSPDAKLFALTDAGPLTLWSVSDGRSLASFPIGAEILSAAFDAQSRKLAVGFKGGEAKVWDLTGPPSEWAGRAPVVLSVPDADANAAVSGADKSARRADVAALGFSPTGDRLLTLSTDRTPRIWDAGSGKLLLTLSAPKRSTEQGSAGFLHCAFSPDGRFVATHAMGHVEFWDAASGKRLTSVQTTITSSAKLEFSADGRRLITTPHEGYPLRIDVPSGLTLGDSENPSVGGFGYDREAEVIAVGETDLRGGIDSALRLLDASTFRTIWRFKGSYDDTDITAGGQRLTALSIDGTVNMWTLPPRGAERVRMARGMVPRCLETLQRVKAGLDPIPPRWCFTGPDHVAEKDPSRWQGKWPYNRKEWRDWLVARDRGESPPWPNLNELFFDPDDEGEAKTAGEPSAPK